MVAKKKLTGKDKAQWIHVKRKCLNRLGVEMTRELHDTLIKKIRIGSPGAEFVEKQSKRITVWKVEHKVGDKDIKFRVVYDKMRKNIVTILNNVEKGPIPLLEMDRCRSLQKQNSGRGGDE